MSDTNNLPLAGLKFLVVEDDLSLLRILKLALSKKGAIVTTAEDGRQAWEIFDKQEFDMVLSDVQMPHSTGVELLTKIRARDPAKPVFLLVTGEAQISEEGAMQLGAAGLVQKPFKLAALLERLEVILAKAKAA